MDATSTRRTDGSRVSIATREAYERRIAELEAQVKARSTPSPWLSVLRAVAHALDVDVEDDLVAVVLKLRRERAEYLRDNKALVALLALEQGKAVVA